MTSKSTNSVGLGHWFNHCGLSLLASTPNSIRKGEQVDPTEKLGKLTEWSFIVFKFSSNVTTKWDQTPSPHTSDPTFQKQISHLYTTPHMRFLRFQSWNLFAIFLIDLFASLTSFYLHRRSCCCCFGRCFGLWPGRCLSGARAWCQRKPTHFGWNGNKPIGNYRNICWIKYWKWPEVMIDTMAFFTNFIEAVILVIKESALAMCWL